MAKVNPPPILKIPKAFLKDKEVRAFIEQELIIIFQLYDRSGGNNDLLEEMLNERVTSQSKSNRNTAQINSILSKEFELIEADTDLITKPFQIIDCINTSTIEITLDPQAIGEDEVHIARSDRVVKIIGTVNGKTNITLNVKGFSVHLIKQITGDGWLQI